ncbi:uncharacterized protein LOC116578781 [Mustela erminea]|uniref:uncharacterized protein LOC116578781 n=1 Tax=Mustela erminea TaxID=36723 RepID=UPI0013867FE0|nr:uncharacterized protein LOC116578781 [Mustela erminea]
MAKLPRSSDPHRPFRGFPALASGWTVRWKDGTREARRTVGEARPGKGADPSRPRVGAGRGPGAAPPASAPSVLPENHQAWGALGTSGTTGDTGIEPRNRRYHCWALFHRPQNSFCCPACRHAPNPESPSVSPRRREVSGATRHVTGKTGLSLGAAAGRPPGCHVPAPEPLAAGGGLPRPPALLCGLLCPRGASLRGRCWSPSKRGLNLTDAGSAGSAERGRRAPALRPHGVGAGAGGSRLLRACRGPRPGPAASPGVRRAPLRAKAERHFLCDRPAVPTSALFLLFDPC